MSTTRPPLPPFDLQTAVQKVQAAEDAWNTCDPLTVALAYTADSVWRNRDQFVTGRAEIVEFLYKKWERELDYALRKELWSFRENCINDVPIAEGGRRIHGPRAADEHGLLLPVR
jgi:nuclear transport factor 2 (NTF2) superfamily protein